ncbi:hypothetical protein AB0I72_00585 [Nocardiopsis sp. NPDC049922]|uniref:hypothetical protein n=1 Tax=Nocardiopsis sp. NPDC049922 TaxID=3155157 RepID=UPI0033EA3248
MSAPRRRRRTPHPLTNAPNERTHCPTCEHPLDATERDEVGQCTHTLATATHAIYRSAGRTCGLDLGTGLACTRDDQHWSDECRNTDD